MFEVQHRHAKSARWWFKNRHDIDMEPEYQRSGGIWSDEDRRFLIDSILNDYDIPKFYIADFSTGISKLNVDRTRYAVIDGKQRLESIFQFLSGELSLSKKFELASDRDIKLAGLRFTDLEAKYPSLASKVEEFPLAVMHIVTDEVERINELFIRLNKGLKLTGAEVRNAMIGPIPKLIRQIASHKFFTECISYSDKRGQSLNVAAKLLAFELEDSIVDTKKSLLDKLVTDHAEYKFSDLESYKSVTVDTLDSLATIFSKNDELLSSQGVVPDYYLVVQGIPRHNRKHFRAFLVDFVKIVRHQRSLEIQRRNKIVSQFLLASRNRNDANFIEERIIILSDMFEAYLDNGFEISFAEN